MRVNFMVCKAHRYKSLKGKETRRGKKEEEKEGRKRRKEKGRGESKKGGKVGGKKEGREGGRKERRKKRRRKAGRQEGEGRKEEGGKEGQGPEGAASAAAGLRPDVYGEQQVNGVKLPGRPGVHVWLGNQLQSSQTGQRGDKGAGPESPLPGACSPAWSLREGSRTRGGKVFSLPGSQGLGAMPGQCRSEYPIHHPEARNHLFYKDPSVVCPLGLPGIPLLLKLPHSPFSVPTAAPAHTLFRLSPVSSFPAPTFPPQLNFPYV